MGQITLWGAGVKGRSSNVSAQRRVNLYANAYQGLDADKGEYVLYPRPGLTQWNKESVGASTYGNGPIRGMGSFELSNTLPGQNYVMTVIGNFVYFSVTPGRFIGGGGAIPINTSVGYVDFTTIPQVAAPSGQNFFFFVDGFDAYSDGTSMRTYSPPVANIPYGCTSCTTIAQRIVVNNPTYRGRFNWSPVGWYGVIAGDWSALDYATAESSPDPLVCVRESRGELVLMGTESIEFWAPTGDSSVFGKVGGAVLQWGTASQQSVRKYNNGLIFLGRNSLGDRQVVQLNGYQAQVVSNPDIEWLIKNDPTPDAATAVCFTTQGHSFYVLNLSTTSVVLNLTTGEWDEWQTAGGRWAGNYGVPAYGKYLVSDYRDSRLWEVDSNSYSDGTDAILRQVDTRHIAQDLERITVNRVTLDVEQGVGLNSGQGSDPQIALQVSRDGGHTFGNELWTSLGAQGKYRERIEWWRLGRARDFVFRFKIFDAVKAVFIGASMDASK